MIGLILLLFSGASAQNGATVLYTCDIRSYAGVCRHYRVPREDKVAHELIRESCLSMEGAKFERGAKCPDQGRFAKCGDLLWNDHDPKNKIAYDNLYYQGWNSQKLIRICADLEGKLNFRR